MKKSDITRQEALEFQKGLIMITNQHEQPYSVRLKGYQFTIFPDTINPNYTKASTFFLDNLGVKGGEQVLDPFTGSGADAILAVMGGAKSAVAIDKYPMPVLCAKYNVLRLGLEDKIDVRQGDLFKALKPEEEFDLVVANPPFKNPVEPEFRYADQSLCSRELDAAVNDLCYLTLRRFFRQAGRHLRPGGRIRMVFSDVGDVNYLMKLVKENGYTSKVVAETKFASSVGIRVYEMRRKNEDGTNA